MIVKVVLQISFLWKTLLQVFHIKMHTLKKAYMEQADFNGFIFYLKEC